ncbi:MAG: HlyD family efflux transporter periplasmic adaptor subunit [Chlorobia bacterium]|nr:HlyD family efflux transporter periplasmic adaptor subunit [Fimbriimonadaceae bacterium]
MNARTMAICCLPVLALIGCDPKSGVATTGKVAEPTSAKVVKQDLVGYAFFEGKVVTPPGAQATVVSPYDVALGEVLVSQGKRVGRGTTIATMQFPDLKASVDQAEMNLKSAQSSYAAAKAQYEAPVREAERMLSEARTAEKQARQDVQAGGSSDLVSATDSRKMAEAAVQSAKATMNSQVLPEKQAMDIAAEYLKDARAGARVANIRTPISGTIVTLEAKPGLVVKSKQTLATIVDLAAVRIQGIAPPAQKDLVKRGVEVLIALDGANSDPFKGVVKEVSILPPSEGESSPGYLAVIDFNNEKGWVLPGTAIKRLGVQTGTAKDVLVVPVGAVETKDGKSSVLVQKGSEWVPTEVTIGLTDGAVVEIKSGINEGDVVKIPG